MLGLDLITPESLYGYEPDVVPVLPGDQSYTTERVVLPDTSQFIESSLHYQGPLVAFPKYNNYLQDKSKFDTSTRVLVPLKLLGIKPIESGELITKHSLSETGAVVSYAQYKQAGALFPETYDASVVRRWGVDITIGSPLISVSILVPEYVDATDGQFTYHKPVVFDNTEHDENVDKMYKKVIMDPQVKVHENDARYGESERRRRSMGKKLFFKSLAGMALSLPIRLQIVLDSNRTVFNERSNPQCVHWSVARGWVGLIFAVCFCLCRWWFIFY